MHWGDGCYGGEHWFHWILFGLLILFVCRMFSRRRWSRHGYSCCGPSCRDTGAEETLKRRYAAGEVSKEDYEKILEDLRK